MDINKRNAAGETLLGLAMEAQDIAMCPKLLDLGAEMNPEPHDEKAPILVAGRKGDGGDHTL